MDSIKNGTRGQVHRPTHSEKPWEITLYKA